jgi:NADP-dependent 3-hydroxy acid dehydrogenase YdfG
MTTNTTFDSRVAVVTGAASGIGEAIARRLASEGASVALLARRAERLESLAAELGPRALALPTDVTDPDAVQAAARAVAERLGRADLLANNAGVMLAAPFDAGRDDEWRRMLDLNLRGLLDVTRAFLPALLEGPSDIVNVSSVGAHIVFPGYAVYGATKAAVTQLGESLRAELAGRGVRVTTIEPGLTATELGDHVEHPEARAVLDELRTEVPALAADDVADLVAYVTSRPHHVNISPLVVMPTRQAAMVG